MFVSHSVTVRVPLDIVQARIQRWLIEGDVSRSASAAMNGAHTSTMRVNAGPLAKEVRVMALDPRPRGDTVVIGLRWQVDGAAGPAFPALDANLELWPSDDETQLVLVGSYRPPLGALGRALDRAGMYKIADGTMQRFLRDIAEFVDPAPLHVESSW